MVLALQSSTSQSQTAYDGIVEALKGHWLTAGIFIVASILIAIPQVRDGAVLLWSWLQRLGRHRKTSVEDSPVLLESGGEKVTFTEMLRTVHHDVVKIHAHTHELGIAAEYEWIRRRYPKSKPFMQALSTLQLIQGSKKNISNEIHFDIVKIRLAHGGVKDIYFDISSFFDAAPSSLIDPKAFIAKRISDLYR